MLLILVGERPRFDFGRSSMGRKVFTAEAMRLCRSNAAVLVTAGPSPMAKTLETLFRTFPGYGTLPLDASSRLEVAKGQRVLVPIVEDDMVTGFTLVIRGF